MVLVGYVLLSYICFSLLSSFFAAESNSISSFEENIVLEIHPVRNDLTICPTDDFLRAAHISVSPSLKEICLLLTESIEGLNSDIVLSRLLQNHLHRLVIISLDFEVGNARIPLCGFDSGVSQQILDGDKVRISIDQLGSHGVAKMMTGYV